MKTRDLDDEKLKKKCELLNKSRQTQNSEQESHRIELCEVTINTLLAQKQDRKNIWSYSFENFLEPMKRYLNDDEQLSDDTSYLICATFLKEYYLYIKRIGRRELGDNAISVWGKFKTFNIEISGHIQISDNKISGSDFYNDLKRNDSVLDLIYYCLSIQKVKVEDLNAELSAYKSKCIDDILNEKNLVDKHFSNFKKNVKSLAGKVEKLAGTLEKQKTAFNFIGLYDGFNNLSEIKNNQKKATYYFSIFLGFLLILIPFLSIILQSHMGFWVSDTVFDFKTLTVTSQFNWVKILPVLGLEFILIYFFRIVLNRLNILQTEIVQIELRKSLCQFIQEYAKYAKELREQSSSDGQEKVNLLEKFENIIFSNILSQPEKVPGTFDGLEQLSNFLKEFKK